MSVNRVILIGYLGQNPIIPATASEQKPCVFSIATNEKYTDRNGNKREKTEWNRIVTGGKLAQTCSQHLTKGRQVYIEGKLNTQQYEAKDGSGPRWTTQIIAQTVQFLGS